MNRILWRVRYVIYMVYLLDWWFRPSDILFAWRASGDSYKARVRGLEFLFGPEDAAGNEIDSWYE